MPKKKQKSFKVTKEQLKKLTKVRGIGELSKKTEYEEFRGKLGKATLVVYEGKRGLTLLIQSITPEVEEIIIGIIGKEKKEIIEIDDSGWGEPVGGVMIVGNRIGSEKQASEEILVDFFQGSKFRRGGYYIMAVRCVNKILTKLKANPKDTKIKICSGTIFSNVYKFLEKNKYEYEKVKIRGETQRLAEGEFNKYLKKLNCPRGYKKMKKWIEEDPQERMEYVKTGWKEFN